MLQEIAAIAGNITGIITFIALVIKPVRERLFGLEAVRDGQRCLLREVILKIYYGNLDDKALRQHEYENMMYCYKAYKTLGGNSFVDHIVDEMRNWTTETQMHQK